ncbi:MAG: DUF4236 domain-containing protein [Chthoniobacterales bacterium]
MGFRFRRSISVLPGIRINIGKTGVSVSAGVPGARVTFGGKGARATVGAPGTGMSYTQTVRPVTQKRSTSSPLWLIPIIIVGVLTRLSRHHPTDSGQLVAVIVVLAVVGVIGITAALLRKAPTDTEPTETKSSAEPPAPPRTAAQPQRHIPPERKASLQAIMRQAAIKKRQKAELDPEHRLLETLSRYRCYYMHNGETLGPVTLWQVREMIEADLFDPDVQVILEGSDYWFTYAEQELRVAPPVAGDTRALHTAAKLQCEYIEQGEVRGPVPLLVIFHKIRLGELPADVQVRARGTQEWRRACDV